MNYRPSSDAERSARRVNVSERALTDVMNELMQLNRRLSALEARVRGRSSPTRPPRKPVQERESAA